MPCVVGGDGKRLVLDKMKRVGSLEVSVQGMKEREGWKGKRTTKKKTRKGKG